MSPDPFVYQTIAQVSRLASASANAEIEILRLVSFQDVRAPCDGAKFDRHGT